jgi:hypothetical protein
MPGAAIAIFDSGTGGAGGPAKSFPWRDVDPIQVGERPSQVRMLDSVAGENEIALNSETRGNGGCFRLHPKIKM